MGLEAGVIACVLLLLIGVWSRASLPPLQWLFVPAAVTGGLVGLGLVQLALHVGSTGMSDVALGLTDELRGWPGWLIAVVFAGLLLDRPKERGGNAGRGREVLRAGTMVWIIVVGQIAVGFGAIWFLQRQDPAALSAIGHIIEAGFAGGHGTAAAVGEVYTQLGQPTMRDYCMFSATIGLIYSVLSGVLFVNIAIRLGWAKSSVLHHRATSGLEQRDAPPAAARAPIAGDVIDPMVWAIMLVALAMLTGSIVQSGFTSVVNIVDAVIATEPGATVRAATAADYTPASDVLGKLHNLPLFLFTLIGGGIVRTLMQWCGVADLIDASAVKRVVGIAMEFLIVAAICSLRIEAITGVLRPLLIMCAVGAVWCAICLFILSPWILPRRYWFELGIINYGMSTGTTAQGMMLLRMIDPELDRGAAETYALAAPLSAPFIGGGMITVLLPVILDRFGAGGIAIAGGVVVGVLLMLAIWLRRPRRSG
ncbi:MAG: hypothetical protein AAF432_00075 [Planctomycetota bacterium]